jgi:hypothetical protein
LIQLTAAISSTPLAPAWLVIPVAIVGLLVVGGHVILIDRAEMPAARKRIRTANGVLMMFTIPLAAAAFSLIAPSAAQSRIFVMTWMLVAGLIVLILFLAVLDLGNTFLMHRKERAELRRQILEARAIMAAVEKKADPV